MRRRPGAIALKWFVMCALAQAVCLFPCFGQQIHRNGFEGRNPSWARGSADAPFDEIAHQMTDQGAHDGQRAEYLQIKAGQGSYVFYQYPCGRAAVSDELSASVWVKSSRPGVQVAAHVVLPHEPDPNNLDSRLTTVLRGDVYRQIGRWQCLEVGKSVTLAKQQQQLLQAQLGRTLNFSDAYVDALLLNVYTGPGVSEIWIDDLEIGPVQTPLAPEATKAAPALASRHTPRGAAVEFNGAQLRVGGKPFFIHGIRHSDTPLKALRVAGFNTLWVDATSDPAVLQEAADLGFWIVPSLPVTQPESHTVSTETVALEVTRCPVPDAVLFWDLGGALSLEQSSFVMQAAKRIREADPGRPLGADVWDGLLPYSRTLNLVGIHRWPLMTAMGLKDYATWLQQRRLLANPGSYFWTWIQTHTPDWYTALVYNHGPGDTFDEPIGPQPEQIRLLTYTAIGAGCRGLGFWSDRFLADSHQGRDRLLCLALLNQEIEMIEPLLVAAEEPGLWVDTSNPEVKASVMRTARGVLVLPTWLGGWAQFVPGQDATNKLTIVVPQVPQGSQAWEVTPGEVRALHGERVLGGTKVTVPEFGLTTAIVFTSDTSLLIRFQEQCRAKRQLAAQWTYELAVLELQKVMRIEEQLERDNHKLPDGAALLKDARDRLQTTRQYWDSRRFTDCYREGQRVLRPVRIVMRAQFDEAIKALNNPVSSPYAVSFYTLPRHWKFMEEFKTAKPGVNLLRGGNFEEEPPGQVQEAWTPQEITQDDVTLRAERVKAIVIEQPTDPKKKDVPPPAGPRPDLPVVGKQCLMLQIKPKNKDAVPQALERTFLAINSPTVHLQPGTLVKVSAWIRIPKALTATCDGALIYDSAGGEPLAYRLRDATNWAYITLYRRVPSSGMINVTVALTGIGAVYFDDIKIEPMQTAPTTAALQPSGNK